MNQESGIKNKYKSILAATLILVFAKTKAAAAFTLPRLIPEACTVGGSPTSACGLPQLVEVGINLARIILALSGSLALIMFIYGGFMWLTAAGTPARVDKGKQILIGAVIGLIIIFGAVTIVNFAQQALKTPTSGGQQGGVNQNVVGNNVCTCSCSGGACLILSQNLLDQAATRCSALGGIFNNNSASCSVANYTAERCQSAEQQLNAGLAGQPISVSCTFIE